MRVAILSVLVLLVAACGQSGRPPAPPPAGPSPSPLASGWTAPRPVARASVRIGLVLDAGTQASETERDLWNGATLAADVVNGRGGVRMPDGSRSPLELLVYDDDRLPERALLAIDRLIEEDGALAIVGPASERSAEVGSRLAERAGVPLLRLDGAAERATGGRWTFSLALGELDALATLVDFLAGTGAERLGWIAPRTASAETARRELVRLTTARDLRLVAEEAYPLSEEEFGEPIARLATAGAERIVAWPRDVRDAAAISRAAAERAPRARLYLGPAAASPALPPLLGDATGRAVTPRLLVADYLWDHDSLTPAVRELIRAFGLRYGTPPTIAGAIGWDAIRLAVDAVERSGPIRSSLRQALETTDLYYGATGLIAFSSARHGGLDRGAFIVARVGRAGWQIPP
jgi:branched-chain amino acid transport system substrate-binding protein